MIKFRIAAQLYTVRDLLKNKSKSEIYDVLKQVKQMGYNTVQISGVGDINKELVNNYQEICEELALEICATHLDLEFLEENFDWVIKYHNIWKCKYVGIGALPDDLRNDKGSYEFARRCNVVAKKLKEKGLVLIYHNHRFEFEKYDGKTMMENLFDTFDAHIEFEIDTYWIQAGGANPIDWIYKVKDRMKVIHFKDFRIIENEQQFAEIGQGNLDWDGIIKACNDIGVKYAAIEQDSYTDDPLNSLKMSIDFLNNK